jgi:flagellar basal-body rod protein FlgC
MKITGTYKSFDISSQGMSLQRRKMNLISENIANSQTTKTSEGKPYQRKLLTIRSKDKETAFEKIFSQQTISLKKSNSSHYETGYSNLSIANKDNLNKIDAEEIKDETPGEIIYMPEHPDADENGYVKMPNVNVIAEMTDMIAAIRSYEANLTAFNAAKQIAKDALEI